MPGRFTKKSIFVTKTKNFHTGIYKQIVGISEYMNNMKVLVELARTSLSISIGNQMFKRFPVNNEDN